MSKKNNKIAAILIAVVLVVGVGFLVTQTETLQGFFKFKSNSQQTLQLNPKTQQTINQFKPIPTTSSVAKPKKPLVDQPTTNVTYYEATRCYMVESIVAGLDLEILRPPEESVFADMRITDDCYPAVYTAYANGIINGYADGLFRPNQPIMRSEAVKVIVDGFNFEKCDYKRFTYNDVYPGEWHDVHIDTAIHNSVFPLATYIDGGPWFFPYEISQKSFIDMMIQNAKNAEVNDPAGYTCIPV